MMNGLRFQEDVETRHSDCSACSLLVGLIERAVGRNERHYTQGSAENWKESERQASADQAGDDSLLRYEPAEACASFRRSSNRRQDTRRITTPC